MFQIHYGPTHHPSEMFWCRPHRTMLRLIVQSLSLHLPALGSFITELVFQFVWKTILIIVAPLWKVTPPCFFVCRLPFCVFCTTVEALAGALFLASSVVVSGIPRSSEDRQLQIVWHRPSVLTSDQAGRGPPTHHWLNPVAIEQNSQQVWICIPPLSAGTNYSSFFTFAALLYAARSFDSCMGSNEFSRRPDCARFSPLSLRFEFVTASGYYIYRTWNDWVVKRPTLPRLPKSTTCRLTRAFLKTSTSFKCWTN